MRTTSLRTASAASRTASSPASRKFGALGKAHTLATDTLYLYKQRIATRYTSFTSLKSFLKVNYSELRNILKKCDKLTHGDLPASPFIAFATFAASPPPPGLTPRRADHFVNALEGAVPAQ
ncbi:uncharacterized protein SCHCODRAFT_01191692 [Schizophyllum commune H4-8]|nr:uncharacterized protein SCHCODRAFT_01191692 [Schizophyllum commune H4-8]KAI5889426.1 hypothetical protein SCHCODRAFT_01191692 [Schizophyllum commune H4-8]